jgi:2-hydroxychromene-2-carboxylate isomerase
MHDDGSELAAAFYFDLASPLCYLASERILLKLGAPAVWQPVLGRDLPRAESFEAFRCENEREIFRAEVARRARQLELQPLVWPRQFPVDSELVMRVATYAKQIGRVVPFTQAAFRQAFAGGRDLSDPDCVVIAAAACEIHPKAALQGAELSSVREALAEATRSAGQAGVIDVPAIRVGGDVFVGEQCVEDAARSIQAAR